MRPDQKMNPWIPNGGDGAAMGSTVGEGSDNPADAINLPRGEAEDEEASPNPKNRRNNAVASGLGRGRDAASASPEKGPRGRLRKGVGWTPSSV